MTSGQAPLPPAPSASPDNLSSAPITRGFSALRHRNYRLFFTGQAISVIGSWMQTTAQSWLVVSLTASALKLSLVNVCQFGPVLLLGLYAGVVVDRVAKRTLLILTQSSAAILAGTLAYLDRTGRVQLWQVYLLALAIGVVNAFDMPARQAFVVEMVGKDDLANAIALNSSLFNAGRLVGPAVAGALLASFGTAVCFALNAISFLPVVAGLLLMRVPAQPVKPRGSGLVQLRDGLRYVRKTPAVALTVILAGLVATFGMNFAVWIPLLAKGNFQTGAGGFGALMSALGFGSMAGALSLAFFGRGTRQHFMLAMAATLGVGEIVLAGIASAGAPALVAMALLPVLGFAMTSTMALANTTVQTATPHELRGRVLSVYLTVFAGSAPFGAIVAGALANALGTPTSLAICGAVTAMAAGLVAMMWGAVPATALRPRWISSSLAGRSSLPDTTTGED